MGNPIITRLGKTQLWYKKWYSNFKHTPLLKQVKTFEDLLYFFFQYGLTTQKNFFYNTFWYKTKCNITRNNQFSNYHLYFRKYFFSHKTLTIEHSYSIRLKTPEHFPLKLYTLRYNNWVLLSLHWFKPSKKNISSKVSRLQNHKIFKNNYTLLTGNSLSKSIKVKKRLLISFFYNKFFIKTNYLF
jgi:hypothetical protein